MAVKYVPTRQCVICRERVPKPDLIRFVVVDGEVDIDRTGKKDGRGAYLCGKKECLEKAQKTKSLERHLKHPVAEQVWQSLKDDV